MYSHVFEVKPVLLKIYDHVIKYYKCLCKSLIHCTKSVIVLTKNNNLTSFLKSNFSELGYIPVPSCPKSLREWNDSSLRLNCNETNKYHCAPYLSKTSQLYEFCYGSLNISKGK